MAGSRHGMCELARHGMGTAEARHGMGEIAFSVNLNMCQQQRATNFEIKSKFNP
jgi:hypothetical protein